MLVLGENIADIRCGRQCPPYELLWSNLSWELGMLSGAWGLGIPT